MTQRTHSPALDGPPPPGNEGSRPRGVLGHRRSFLVNRRYQLKASILTASVVLILLVFINLLLYSASTRSSARILADSPELEAIILAQDRMELVLMVLASLVFLAGFFMVSVLETHKTAGAAYNLSRRLGEIERGHYTTALRLRRGDNLAELEPAFNRMARALRDRTWEDVETLRRLADESERGGATATELTARLRELADRRQALVE